MKYNEAKSTREYLEYVLTDWNAFRKANGGVCRAIADILAENDALKKQVKRLKKQVK